jgi:hypothetical protein
MVMISNREQFLNLHHFPARLTAKEAGWLLGFEEHDIAVLVRKKILKPLGNPPPNCAKRFHLQDIQDLAGNRKELAKASDAIRRGGTKSGERQTIHLDPERAPLSEAA